MPPDQLADARDAEKRFDWDAAAAAYEVALNAAADRNAPPEEIARLLTALGRCQRNLGEARAAWRSLMRAIGLVREAGDAVAMADASLEALRIWAPPERRESVAGAALAMLGEGESLTHAQLLLYFDDRDDDVTAMARRHGYDGILAQLALWTDGPRLASEGRFDEYIALVETAHQSHEDAGDFERASDAYRGAGYGLLALGDFARGVPMAEAAAAYARAHNLRFPTQLAELDIVGVAFARDELDRCVALLDAIPGALDFRIDLYRAWIAERRGDATAAVGLLPSPERAGGASGALSQVHAGRAGVLWRAGREAAAMREVEAFVAATRDDYRMLQDAPAALEAILATGDTFMFREIEAWGRRWPLDHYSTLQGRGIDRVRGWMALRLGDREAAVRYFRDGIAWAEREGCPPDAAWCREGLAAAQQ